MMVTKNDLGATIPNNILKYQEYINFPKPFNDDNNYLTILLQITIITQNEGLLNSQFFQHREINEASILQNS